MKRLRKVAGAKPAKQAKPNGAQVRPGGAAAERKGGRSGVLVVLVVSAEMVDPAPCMNDQDPICVALTEVVADLLNSTDLTSYRLAQIVPLSREEIRKLRRCGCLVSIKSAVIVARSFFFTYTELVAIAEERLR